MHPVKQHVLDRRKNEEQERRKELEMRKLEEENKRVEEEQRQRWLWEERYRLLSNAVSSVATPNALLFCMCCAAMWLFGSYNGFTIAVIICITWCAPHSWVCTLLSWQHYNTQDIMWALESMWSSRIQSIRSIQELLCTAKGAADNAVFNGLHLGLHGLWNVSVVGICLAPIDNNCDRRLFSNQQVEANTI